MVRGTGSTNWTGAELKAFMKVVNFHKINLYTTFYRRSRTVTRIYSTAVGLIFAKRLRPNGKKYDLSAWGLDFPALQTRPVLNCEMIFGRKRSLSLPKDMMGGLPLDRHHIVLGRMYVCFFISGSFSFNYFSGRKFVFV